MKRSFRLSVMVILSVLCLWGCFIVSADEADDGNDIPTETQSGWINTDGDWYFYDDSGNLKTGWLKWNDRWYFLSSDGKMKTGWLKSNDKWYFLDEDWGFMKTGWLKYNDKWYFLDEDWGFMKTGWLKYNDKWYFLNEEWGFMKTGWLKYNDKWYFLNEEWGFMKTGWLKWKDNWYYLYAGGIMATDFVKIGTKTAYLNSNGRYIAWWDTADEFLTKDVLNNAAKTYSVSKDSNSFYAMVRINSVYSSKLSAADKAGTLLFLFEGAGKTADISVRKNALGVLVRNSKIIYLNRCCSTIPDCPFDPARNYDTPMPTLKSGIYSFKTIYHSSATTQCAGLKVVGAQVVRHNNQYNYYSSTSDSINIHRRNRDFVAKNANEQISSAGCLLIGNAGKKSTDEYAEYSAILGITNKGDSGTAGVAKYINGKVIVDRSYAFEYLKSIGYTDGAIKLIG